tara:strand:- start:2553 stop:3038 length:486 start_codon:yes stop_codon:yes gene_type:complete
MTYLLMWEQIRHRRPRTFQRTHIITKAPPPPPVHMKAMRPVSRNERRAICQVPPSANMLSPAKRDAQRVMTRAKQITQQAVMNISMQITQQAVMNISIRVIRSLQRARLGFVPAGKLSMVVDHVQSPRGDMELVVVEVEGDLVLLQQSDQLHEIPVELSIV